MRAVAYENKGDHDRAIMDYSKLISITKKDDPYLALSHWNRGSIYWNRGDYYRADTDFSKAIQFTEKEDMPSDYRYYRAKLYMKKGDYARAIADAMVHADTAWIIGSGVAS